MREPRAPVPLSVRSYLWMWLGSPGAGSRLGGPPSHSEVCTPQAGVPRGVPSGAVWRAARAPARPAPREEGRAGLERAGLRAGGEPEPSRAAPSYKLYCDALTTTDGPCQTFPRLAVLSTFGRTMGPERGTRPAACNRCICARSWAPVFYLIRGNQSPRGVSDLF